jgi:hypothetical protein
MFRTEADSGFGNAIPRSHVSRAVLIYRVILARTICVLNVRKLVRALGDALLVLILYMLGTVSDPCHT